MLKIRLARGGRKKSPYYRILVTEVTSPRDSNFIEKLGTYNPLLPKDSVNRITIKKDRIEYWLSVGAQPSDKVAKLLIALGVKNAEKYAPKYQAKPKGSNLKKKALDKLAKQKEAQQKEIEQKEIEAKAAQEAKLKAQEEAKKEESNIEQVKSQEAEQLTEAKNQEINPDKK